MKRRALSIPEVLVAAGLGLVLMAVALVLFRRVTSASFAGASRLQLQLSTRETLRKIVPLLKMATPPNSQQTGIYSPDLGVTAGNVVFCSPEDMLHPNPPEFNPRDPVYLLLQIRHDATSRQILLEDFYTPARHTVLGYQVRDFQVVHTQRIGLRLKIVRELTVRDPLGHSKPLQYELSDSLQLPE